MLEYANFVILRAMIPKDGAEKKKYYQELKRAKKAAQMQKYREKIGKKKTEFSTKKSAVCMRKKRANDKLQLKREEERKEKDRIRHYNEYHRKKGQGAISNPGHTPSNSAFRNKFHKCRTLKKVEKAIPDTPSKRKEAEIIAHRIKKCPLTRENLVSLGVAYSEEAESRNALNSSIVDNITTNLKQLQSKNGTLPEDKRKVYTTGIELATSSAPGKSPPMSKLCKQLGVGRKKISSKQKIALLEKSFASRKKRKDAIPNNHLEIANEYWITKSRPTGDRRDIKRKRIGPKSYKEHAKHVLEKTEREVFRDFKRDHPTIKMGETIFRSCKPYFVVPARRRDRVTCLCRKHFELKMVMISCAKFRASCTRSGSIDSATYPELNSTQELVQMTLCEKQGRFHKIECLTRNCTQCGIVKLKLTNQEMDFSEDVKVKWQKYGYVDVGEKEDGSKIRKLTLLEMETSPGELFSYLKDLLKDFPYHDFIAKWQREQFDHIKQCLPLGHILALHDYSENYQCCYQNEVQSLYFAKSEASLHVTVLYRHAMEEFDGEQSTEENPIIIKEHIFTILDDKTHDNYAVQQIKLKIDSYLKNEVKCEIKMMHEWCDGCSAQYKSCHCMGDVSLSEKDFGYPTLRHYYETAHAKGEQDSAGAHVKQKCAMAVIRQEAVIRNARDMYNYLQQNFTQSTRTNSEVKRRVFFYIEGDITRKGRAFQPVPENRKIHSIQSQGNGKLLIRKRSCYCDHCIVKDYDNCTNKDMVDSWVEHEMTKVSEPSERITRSDVGAEDAEHVAGLTELVQKGSIIAIAADDPAHDYYLLKVTSDGAEQLKANTTDAYGNSFLQNTFVFKGNFFDAENRLDNVYKLTTKHRAICYVETVRYIASDIESLKKGRKTLYKIPLQLHEDILAAM